MPDLYIITGSNGAGKSTLGAEYLPEHIKSNNIIFDGDLLYTKELSRIFPKIVPSAKYARKEALDYVVQQFEEQTKHALENGLDYVYEGHFTNDETWETPKLFKESGYRIYLLFFGLENTELSQFRVTERVTDGGHYVDPQTLENNFFGNLEKLNDHFHFIDELTIVDTSDLKHTILLKLSDGKIEYSVEKDELPDWFTTYMPLIAALI
ncbi:zeta toxin family protein [Sphingobacterium siyangense]|uniref:zeta toxin family protein n=1 Tax=Sphingobacterium siyangense TaxID=459529 RepID=UPI003015D77C